MVCIMAMERNPSVQTDLWCRFDGPSIIDSSQKSHLRAIDVHPDGGSALHPGRHVPRTKTNQFTQITLLAQNEIEGSSVNTVALIPLPVAMQYPPPSANVRS